jgi:hypothetical protein
MGRAAAVGLSVNEDDGRWPFAPNYLFSSLLVFFVAFAMVAWAGSGPVGRGSSFVVAGEGNIRLLW